MGINLDTFSDYVLSLDARANNTDLADFVAGSVASLSNVLGFDAAWYGWAHLQPERTVIHTNATLNLPESYFDTWTQMAHEDLLVDRMRKDPNQVAIYNRRDAQQTEGMADLSDRFAIPSMATAMNQCDGRTASFFLSVYRGAGTASGWTVEERALLRCAIRHIAAGARRSAAADLTSQDETSAAILVSEDNAVIAGRSGLVSRFGSLWARGGGDVLPRWLADFAREPGEHVLPDRSLVIKCTPFPTETGLRLNKVSLRVMQNFDFLSHREKQVARELAAGRSHKQVAQQLGISPATVRNQTQSIYAKLAVDNRADLTRQVISAGAL
ncbi:LuxR C-terminal-related transcriptional regulator [Thalassococcus sp. S3]|uniref:helix-turn-helix transcriptional regulator n=1 Tax=Thalassococcus sp. S3 TaxID=2017482 RepID=UPI0010247FF7|nr:LuxR C-terminal-related transcriptional regulator [Thalassococcus sp. S3]QBF30827.1 hypothetical protein CFI11_06305 [Thalassococcus sp. S3]